MPKPMRIARAVRAMSRLVCVRSSRWDATRTLPLDTLARARAQSLLAGIAYLDGTTNPGPLSLDQSHDVLRWAASRIP